MKKFKKAFVYRISNFSGIYPSFGSHKLVVEKKFKLCVQPQRKLNSNVCEVVKKEVIKLLDAGLIYPISDSEWVSLV